MAAINDFDYVLMTKPDGSQVILPVPFGTGCSVGTVNKTPAEVAALSAMMPATPSGAEVLTRSCSGSGDTYVDASNDDYTPPSNGGGNPDPTPGSIQEVAGTQYTYTGTLNSVGTQQNNPSALNVVVSALTNGRVTITNSVTTSPPQGKVAKYLFRNTEPYLDTLNLSISPEGRPIIQLFYVDASTPSYTWQATGAVAFSILNFN